MQVVTLFYKGKYPSKHPRLTPLQRHSILIQGTVVVDNLNRVSFQKKLQVEGNAVKIRKMHVFPQVTMKKETQKNLLQHKQPYINL